MTSCLLWSVAMDLKKILFLLNSQYFILTEWYRSLIDLQDQGLLILFLLELAESFLKMAFGLRQERNVSCVPYFLVVWSSLVLFHMSMRRLFSPWTDGLHWKSFPHAFPNSMVAIADEFVHGRNTTGISRRNLSSQNW